MIKIAIADDNIFALKAIEEKLSAYDDIAIVHKAPNGAELLELLSRNSDVDLILMDIEMDVMNGIDATEKVKRQYPDIKIVMITIYDDDDTIFNAIKAGAASYILKETKAEKIHETIHDTLNGGSVMSPSIAIKTLRLLKNASLSRTTDETEKMVLSERETEILEHLGNGLSNKMIAEKIFISPFTVKRHIENIYQKLQARNRIELLSKARKNRLI